MITINESPQASRLPITGLRNPMEYVSLVLKTQLGNSDEFLAFERYFYYQNEEIKSVKNSCEELRTTVSQLQEEKRSLELQLVMEKALRDQECKNVGMEIEKINVQRNAEMYTLKCEVETWKRKSETKATECAWLKDHMKAIEIEKNKMMQKLTELKSRTNEFERYRQSFDSYSRRLKDSMLSINKKLDELEKAKESFEKLSEHNKDQIEMMSSLVNNREDERSVFRRKIASLENELLETKAELVQNSSKLSRAEMTEASTAALVNQLLEENKGLQRGLQALSQSLGSGIKEADQKLVEKINQLHEQIDSNVKRLHLCKSDFTPPSNSR